MPFFLLSRKFQLAEGPGSKPNILKVFLAFQLPVSPNFRCAIIAAATSELLFVGVITAVGNFCSSNIDNLTAKRIQFLGSLNQISPYFSASKAPSCVIMPPAKTIFREIGE